MSARQSLIAMLVLTACGDGAGPGTQPALIVFESDRDGGQVDIDVMAAAGGEVRNMTNESRGATPARWSAGRNNTAFSSRQGDRKTDIIVVNAGRPARV